MRAPAPAAGKLPAVAVGAVRAPRAAAAGAAPGGQDQGGTPRPETPGQDGGGGEPAAKAEAKPYRGLRPSKYRTLTVPQRKRLEEVFWAEPKPNTLQKRKLAKEVGIEYDHVKTWFSNRRTKEKVQRAKAAVQASCQAQVAAAVAAAGAGAAPAKAEEAPERLVQILRGLQERAASNGRSDAVEALNAAIEIQRRDQDPVQEAIAAAGLHHAGSFSELLGGQPDPRDQSTYPQK